ncbi:MAG: GxxExxY protein [Candidatus Hydrogenedens sp.]|nr:GxxExxY protein [Candidatus Hydrogenedens sp.]
MAEPKKKRNILQKAFGGPETPDEILDHLRREAPEFHAIVEAAMAVWDELRFGYTTKVYAQALSVELNYRGIAFEQNVPITLQYRGETLDTGHTADFICQGDILLIVRSKIALQPQDDAELVSQLKSAEFQKGLGFNFGPSKLSFKRVVAHPSARKR